MAQAANRSGFTLIEIAVALLVVAIAANYAVASYRHSLLRSYRIEAEESLLTAAAEQEKFHLAHGRYSDRLDAGIDDEPQGLRVPSITPRHRYALAIERADAGVFKIVATPLDRGGQQDDKDCRQFTIDESGRRQSLDSAGNDSTNRCW